MNTLLILFFLFLLIYLLYINGYAIYQRKSAVVFIGHHRCKDASFSLCHGEIRRVLRVKETKVYHFILECNITEGSLDINILDKNKAILCTLSSNNQNIELLLEQGSCYYIQFLFNKASGFYHLDWV